MHSDHRCIAVTILFYYGKKKEENLWEQSWYFLGMYKITH